MAQSGYTPILIYASGSTGNTPSASNLTSSASGAELALNYFDGKLFYKDASGNVQVLASKAGNINVSSISFGTTGLTPNTATTGAVTVAGTLATTKGGTGLTAFTSGGAVYATSTSALTTGTLPVASGGTGLTSLTANQIPYGNGTSAFQSSANLTFNGTSLTLTGTGFIKVNDGTNDVMRLYQSGGTSYIDTGSSTQSLAIGTSGAYPLIFRPNGAEAGRFITTGQFGVGLTPSNNNYYIQSAGGVSASASVVAQGSLQPYTGKGIFLSWETTYGRLEAYDYGSSAYQNIGISPNGGNVGIGIVGSSTYGKLAVSGNMAQWGSVSSGSELTRIQWYNTATNYDVSSIRTFIGSGQVNRGELGFYVNNGAGQLQAMYINYAQQVLVGAGGSQYQQFNVYSASGSDGIGIQTGSGYGALVMRGATENRIYGIGAVPLTFYANGTEYGRFTSAGYLGIGTSSPSQQLSVLSNTDCANFQCSGQNVSLYVNNSNASWDSVCRFNNTASGKWWDLRLGNSSSTSSPPFTIYNTNSAGVQLNWGSTSWTSYSDPKLKNITGTYTDPLTDIAQIKTIKFTWKNDAENKPQVGVDATTVQNVVPEAMDVVKKEGEIEGYLGVRYTELIPLMIASIQALTAEVNQLKSKLGA